ncbi:MAG TPA: ABC transporter permease [Bryobacteraceae bacterium]|nr:ABC transporter permease [Bryobacteraceae bacterium]
MHALWMEIRYGVRSLLNSPGFALLAVLALALGIGANTAIFSVVNGVLLRPLAYGDPDRLVVILHGGSSPASPADYLDWRKQARSFEDMGAAQSWGATLTGRDNAQRLVGMQVSANLFSVLGVQAIRGRTFQAGEDQAGREHVAVLSYGLWQKQFGGDPQIAGKQILLNGETYDVAGVMPESFRFAPFWVTNAEIWVPLTLEKRLNDRGGRSLRVFARLNKGLSLEKAQAEIDVICKRLEDQYPVTNAHMTARVIPLQEKVVANIRSTLLVLLGTVGFVLLIACSNVANLMLVRASGRRKETAVRLALGSSRWRLIRQLVVEGLLLSAAGALLATWIARWGMAALIASLPAGSLPRLEEVQVDTTVLAFTALIALATGILCGLAPALRAFRTDLQEALKGGGRGLTQSGAERRTRALLVIAEVALSLVLLVGAGLMLKTFQHLEAVEPGFDPGHLLTLEVAAGGASYAGPARVHFFEQLRPRLEALPGVDSVSLINHLPISGDVWTIGIVVADRPAPPPGQQPTATYRVVQPGYFATMKIPILRGRDFTTHDSADGAPVAIVNEELAKRHWPNQDPIGQRFRMTARWMTVVGVIKNVKQTDWIGEPDDEMYLPHAQVDARAFSYMTVVMRAHGDPLGLAKAVEGEVHGLDKNVPIARMQTMEQVIGDKLWRGRLAMTLLGLFAGVAVALACLGIYGAISYSVAQRTGEIGIRMALGAQSSEVLAMVLRQGLTVVGIGIAIGLAGSWMLTRTLTGLLYGVQTTDPATFFLVPVVLIALSALACALPAIRAARVDPLTALRHE